MKRLEKLKVLIDSIKTANELMRKQIEINGRAVELLGEFITEPETLGKTPLISTLTRVAEELESEVKGEYQEIPIGVVGKDGKVEPYIKPEDMKAGEWYVVESLCHWLFQLDKIKGNVACVKKHVNLMKGISYYENTYLFDIQLAKSLRKATQKEILKYFPNELEVPTHGGNDAAYIQEVTDPQV